MGKKTRKVLFINPPITDIDNPDLIKTALDWRSIQYAPYGLLSICSYIEMYSKNKVELKIVDLNNEICKGYCDDLAKLRQGMFELLDKSIQEFQPDIVGISIMFSVCYNYMDIISDYVKKHNSDTLVIAGGNFATGLYQEVIAHKNIDAVSYGEGEIPICNLVDSDDIWTFIQSDPSFITKESVAIGKKPFNNLVLNLDELPEINFDFIDISNYTKPSTRVYQKDEVKTEDEPVTMVAYSSRGCPFNCCFCACHVIHDRRIRLMSIERFVNEIKRMKQRYNMKGLLINDDNFLLDKVRAKAILRELVKLDIRVYLLSILVRNIDEEIAALLKELGTTHQMVSIESGSEYVLKHIIEKPLRKNEMKNAIESLRKYDISIDTNIVIGFPGEKDEHREETLQTILEVGFDWVHVLIALPVPGSRLYRQCKEKGYLINEGFFSPKFTECNINTEDYSHEHIEKQAYMMNLHSNFVQNYNLRIGNFERCIVQFRNISKMVPNHAFAYYGLMKAYEGKGDKQSALQNKIKFNEIIGSDNYWRDWAKYFQLI